jgi:anti-sigma regulatory factor (Ser/Thr protein kinase)
LTPVWHADESSEWHTRAFRATPDAPSEARTALKELLSGFAVDPTAGDDIRLLVSELVTNALRHSGTDEIRLTVRPGDPLRFGVHDTGHGMPRIRDDDRPGGYGLPLVERLALRWGVERLPHGKTVWFDVPGDTTESR